MPARFAATGASRTDAPFVLCLLSLAFLLYPGPATARDGREGCAPAHIDERVRVVHVFDGDTVKLGDGRRLRLIGIDAPETGRDGSASQPYAEAARAALQAALQSGGNALSLQFGEERSDRYGRLLAHAYRADGTNLAVVLLRRGLATTLAIPPNTATADCYLAMEQEARAARRGLWRLAAYRVIDADSLAPDTRGLRIVRGEVTGITRTRSQLRLGLPGRLQVRIAARDLGNFAAGYLESLAGQTVEVRGRIEPEQHGLGVRVRHPAAIVPAGTGSNH